MALTDPEKLIVENILLVEARAARAAGNFTPIADFASLTMVQQKAFLLPKVQTIRDTTQAELTGLPAATTLRETTLNNELSVLDGLLVKLAP